MTATADAIATVEAPIGYLHYTGEMPTFYQSNVAGERTRFEGEREKHVMVVRNARLLHHTFSLNVEGFALVPQPTKVKGFYDDAEVAAVYNPECEALLKAHMPGAQRVFVFDHTRRSSSQAVREKHNARDPAGAAHTDYTDWSARQRIKDLLPGEAEASLAKRFAIVNVWRSIAGVVEQWPMAFCDARSVDDNHLHTVERRAYNRVGQTRHASYDAGNQWYYFPAMTRDEAVLIKNYDSHAAQLGVAPYSLHTSFEDPTSLPDAAPRESMETRALVFFD